MSTPRRRATYDDLVKVPEPLVAELVDGELFTSPRPAFPHALVTSTLGMALASLHGLPGPGRPGGWWILDEPELHFGDDVLVPDAAGWRHERMPRVPGDVVACTLPPDWACEVISPTTGYLDRSRKMPIYARAGVPYLWLIDPSPRTLEVYRLEQGRWIVAATHGGSVTVRAEPFEEIEIDLRRLWGEA
jgi:Uma2 family endonuclease